MDTLWDKFRKYYLHAPEIGFALDISRVNFDDAFISRMETPFAASLKAMSELEKGAIANPDEKRMVGHYWLRAPELAPSEEIRRAITETILSIKSFAKDIHSGAISPAPGKKFKSLLVIGIGGSALGPQFINHALSGPKDPLKLFFFDNTDPDGMDRTLSFIPNLSELLVVVISKSGGTKETRNGQLVAKHAIGKQGLSVSNHFVAVTGEESELDKVAVSEKWLARFPMWDWVGGRTSELSDVGLLPAALQGFDIDAFLQGAREMDQLGRNKDLRKNPAGLLAVAWHSLGNGRGAKDMVVLPYKDRLELFSRYLQQLVMESLGKEHDLSGNVVEQGIAVYGNKGSTDQHAYVQQLRDGLNNFFAVFIEVLRDEATTRPGGAAALEVEPGVNCGDYLSGFYLGTRRALFEKGRQSITVTIDAVSERSIGQLIALFERTVGLYASLINVNAYHQPGVEAGKKAAGEVLKLQGRILETLSKSREPQSVSQIASTLGVTEEEETIFKILNRLTANKRIFVESGGDLFNRRYRVS